MDATDKHFAYNEAVRQKLDHEHSVMSSRTGWHHAIQIAMFTGFYSLFDLDSSSNSHLLEQLKHVLPILGIIYALSALYSLWVSERARACILMHWNRYLAENNLKWEDFPPVSGDPIPHIRNSNIDPTIAIDMKLKCYDRFLSSKCFHWFMLYKFIPILFVILWCICLYQVHPFVISIISLK